MQQRETVTLLEAATITGKNKSTISKRLAHKDLNKRPVAEKDVNGEWKINLHSLMQQYKVPMEKIKLLEEADATGAIVKTIENSTEGNTNNTDKIKDLEKELALTSKDLEHAKEKLKDRDETITELKARNEKLEQRNDEKDIRLLAYHEIKEKKKINPALKVIVAVLVLSVIVGAVLYRLELVNVPEGLKIENTGASMEAESPQQ
jgi:septal ring factor EnvC (AmiA/AmiB activator)